MSQRLSSRNTPPGTPPRSRCLSSAPFGRIPDVEGGCIAWPVLYQVQYVCMCTLLQSNLETNEQI
jgi:hypothetical protein